MGEIRALRVMVLGGTGFIGAPLCAALAARGHDVVGVARTAPRAAHRGRFVSADLAAPSGLRDLLAQEPVDVIVNAAGGMWGLNEAQMHTANVGLVRYLVDAAAASAGRPRIVQLGTVHEYGLVPVGRSMGEADAPEPAMPYGELKLEATRMLLDAFAQGAVDGVVLRVGNVVGARQPAHSLLGVVAAKLAAAADAGTDAELVLAPLRARRDFVDLDDTVDAIAAAVESSVTGHVVNIGRGVGVSARDMVERLVAVSGVPTRVVDQGEDAPDADTMWQCMDVEAARTLLGWKAQRSLDDSMRALWEARPADGGSDG